MFSYMILAAIGIVLINTFNIVNKNNEKELDKLLAECSQETGV